MGARLHGQHIFLAYPAVRLKVTATSTRNIMSQGLPNDYVFKAQKEQSSPSPAVGKGRNIGAGLASYPNAQTTSGGTETIKQERVL